MKKQETKGSISLVEVQAACKAILASDKFTHSPRMSRLLKFLVDNAIAGNTRNTSEYAIGISVFDRDALTYCTTEDPAVRVQVGRLREKLKDYYATVASEIEISIPMGSYMPVFKRLKDANAKSDWGLVICQFKCITEHTNGESFAHALQEELLHQLYLSFDSLPVINSFPEGVDVTKRGGLKRASDIGARFYLEGCVRIDAVRLRASVRLLETANCQIIWSKQFDRKNIFDIKMQEDLASLICVSIKQYMAENKFC